MLQRRSAVAVAGCLAIIMAALSPAQTAQPPAPAAGAPVAPPLTRTTILRADDLRADLGVLRRVYETLHPGLYRYRTPAQMAARFDALDNEFQTDRTLGDAFLALTRLTAAVQCGHSYPNFWNQPKAVANALFEGRDKLPFRFRWIDRRMVVIEDGSQGLARGTEIVSIDGVGAGKILETLLPLARADGGNDAKRVAYLEVRGREKYHAFDILYPLVFPVRDAAFTLVVRRPGAKEKETVRVAAIDGTERRAGAVAKPEAASETPLWSYEEQDGLGILRMPTWALYDSKWDYGSWTDSLIADVAARDVKDLVLDLRENEGGVDAGNRILAHMIDKPLRLPLYHRNVRYRRVPEDLVPVLDTWDPSFRDWSSEIAGPADSTFYRLATGDAANRRDVIEPAAPRYRGRVWVLVGAVNSSATFNFALAVKESGVAKLVGQPTGGNRRGINGNAFFFVRLPRTRLEVDLPLVATFPETPQPDAGVTPDIAVTPRIAEIAAGTDPELAAVRAQIRRAAGGAARGR